MRGSKTVILTPNVIEFSRLRDALGVSAPAADDNGSDVENVNAADEATLQAVCRELDGVTILKKGTVDLISDGEHLLQCDVEGGPRRSGGLGDILAGTLGIVYAWATMAAAAGASEESKLYTSADQEHLWAALAACSIVRSSCGAAFAKEKRATTVCKPAPYCLLVEFTCTVG